MDIVEFVENILGLRLMGYQKRMLRKMSELKPDDIHVFPSRRGKTIITVPKENGSCGNRCKVMIVDETVKED